MFLLFGRKLSVNLTIIFMFKTSSSTCFFLPMLWTLILSRGLIGYEMHACTERTLQSRWVFNQHKASYANINKVVDCGLQHQIPSLILRFVSNFDGTCDVVWSNREFGFLIAKSRNCTRYRWTPIHKLEQIDDW